LPMQVIGIVTVLAATVMVQIPGKSDSRANAE